MGDLIVYDIQQFLNLVLNVTFAALSWNHRLPYVP